MIVDSSALVAVLRRELGFERPGRRNAGRRGGAASGVLLPGGHVAIAGRKGPDSRPEIDPERKSPRHLRPEDFGRASPSLTDETLAVRAAGDDVQLRTAVQHLQAWDRLRPRNRRR